LTALSYEVIDIYLPIWQQDQTDTRTDGLVPGNPRSAGNLQTPKLESLLCSLREHINDAIKFQKLAPWPTAASSYTERQEGNWWISWLSSLVLPVALLKLFTSLIARCYSKQSGSQPLTISTVQPALAPVVNLPSKKLKPETHRAPLTDLYTVLSHKLKCGCHFVHLGLRSAPVSPSESGFSSSGLENPALICSLFVTLDLRTSMDSYVIEDPLYLKVLRHKSSNESASYPISTPPQSPTMPLTSCSTIITSPVGSRHCLRCETPAQTEFLVQSARPPVCCPPANTLSNSPTYNPILTLRDILTSDSQEGNTIKLQDEDRLLLADKFVYWVTQYYDTPWLRDLDTHKIRFFTRYENDPKYANWTPYISASLRSTSLEPRKYNNELRALGLVLLQLGLNKLPDYFPDNDWAQIIEIASCDLPSTLGARYTHIVKKLLTEGGEGDRRGGKQIDDLAHEIRQRLAGVLHFLSPQHCGLE